MRRLDLVSLLRLSGTGGYVRRRDGRADGRPDRCRGNDRRIGVLRRGLRARLRPAAGHSGRDGAAAGVHRHPVSTVLGPGDSVSAVVRLGRSLVRGILLILAVDRRQLPDALLHSVHGRDLLRPDLDHLHLRSDQVTGPHLRGSGRQETSRHGLALVAARPGNVLHRHEPLAVPPQQLSPPKIREFLADFGPAIALAAMTVVSVWLHEVFLDVLPAPDTFGTTSGRPWAVDLLAAPGLGSVRRRRSCVARRPCWCFWIRTSPPDRQQPRSPAAQGRGVSSGSGGGGAADGGLFVVRTAVAGGRNGSLAQSRPQSGHGRGGGRPPTGDSRPGDPRPRESLDRSGDPPADWTLAVLAAAVEDDPHGRLVRLVPVHGRGLHVRQPVLRTTQFVVERPGALPGNALYPPRAPLDNPRVYAAATGLPRRLVVRQEQCDRNLVSGFHRITCAGAPGRRGSLPPSIWLLSTPRKNPKKRRLTGRLKGNAGRTVTRP